MKKVVKIIPFIVALLISYVDINQSNYAIAARPTVYNSLLRANTAVALVYGMHVVWPATAKLIRHDLGVVKRGLFGNKKTSTTEMPGASSVPDSVKQSTKKKLSDMDKKLTKKEKQKLKIEMKKQQKQHDKEMDKMIKKINNEMKSEQTSKS